MIYVLYHSNCPDGFGAAFAAWLKLKETAKYIPVSHGEEPPAEIYGKNYTVYIVDFSYTRKVLERLKEAVGSLVVLDHHKTAEQELKDLSYCTFDMNRSGALIAFDYFSPVATGLLSICRLFFEYISDRDLWQWKLPNSQEINAYLMSLDYKFDIYHNALLGFIRDHERNDYILQGKAILRKDKKDVDMICAQAAVKHWTPIGSDMLIHCVHVNATSHWSDVGNRLLELYPSLDISISYHRLPSGDWEHSLRSRKDIDVSKIAALFGGGGHKNASGFTSKTILNEP